MNAVALLTSNLAARLRGLCQSQEERGELWTELIFVLITLDTAAASARTRGWNAQTGSRKTARDFSGQELRFSRKTWVWLTTEGGQDSMTKTFQKSLTPPDSVISLTNSIYRTSNCSKTCEKSVWHLNYPLIIKWNLYSSTSMHIYLLKTNI